MSLGSIQCIEDSTQSYCHVLHMQETHSTVERGTQSVNVVPLHAETTKKIMQLIQADIQVFF